MKKNVNDLQLKLTAVLVENGFPFLRAVDVVSEIANKLATSGAPPTTSALKTPEPSTKELSTKGLDNFTEVPETTAQILVSMGTREFFGIPQIAEKAGLSTETVRRYLAKVLLPNSLVEAGVVSRPISSRHVNMRGFRKIETPAA